MPHAVTRVLLCTNRRAAEPSCGQRADTQAAAARLRAALEEAVPDCQVQVIETRCLGRCQHGPVLITLPDRVWYRWRKEADVEEIAHRHIGDGEPVRRLTMRRQRPWRVAS